jgi:Thiamine pyrophosphate enzyme, central domain
VERGAGARAGRAAGHRPAFVIGAAVDCDGAWHEAVALAERHNARVFVAPMSGRCGFPEDHRLFAGFLPAMRERIVQLSVIVEAAPTARPVVHRHLPILEPQTEETAMHRRQALAACAALSPARAVGVPLQDALVQPVLIENKCGSGKGSPQRWPLFPDVPTLDERGLKGFDAIIRTCKIVGA